MKKKIAEDQHQSFLTFNDGKRTDFDIYLILIQLVVANGLFVILMVYFRTFFSLEGVSSFSYIPGILLICLLFMPYRRTRIIALLGYMILALAVFAVFHSLVLNGIFIWLNQLYELIGKHTGTVIAPYQTTIAVHSHSLGVSLWMVFIAFIFAPLSFYIVTRRRAVLLWVLWILLFALQSILQVDHLFIANVAAVCVGTYVFVKSINSRRNIQGSPINGITRFAFVFLVAILLTVGAIFFSFYPINEVKKDTPENKIAKETAQFIHDTRYEKDSTHTFTEGDFSALGELDMDDEPALEIVMESPTSVYLRGFVGSVYTSDRWRDLDPEVYYEKSDLFYWLNEESFHPLNQLSAVNERMKDDEQLTKTSVKVHNVQASSQYLYTPYGLTSDIRDFSGVRDTFHQTIESNRIFGERIYQFETAENAVVHYPKLARFMYEADDEDVKAYKNAEQHYNTFVYDHYTDIPEKAIAVLEHHLGTEEHTSDEHMAYEKAINEVRSFLSDHVRYQVNPAPLPEDRDFLIHVLEDSKEGYATHFATVATLMFRHLGIPSRYVEGYLVTPESIEDKDAFEEIDINGTDAHAWTEIYIDQIGWVPVETTPPYDHVMADVDTSNYPEGEEDPDEEEDPSGSDDETEGSQKIDDEPEKEVITHKEKESGISGWTYVTYIGIGILILMFVGCLVFVIKKRLSVKKIKQSYYIADVNTAVANMFSRSLFLLHYNGLEKRGGSHYDTVEDVRIQYGESYANQFHQAVKLNQLSVYSKQTLSEQDRQYMLDYIEETITNLKQSNRLLKRIKMKYWDVVY